ncbi:hypothetical protein [Streptomyces sp. YIM 98790]|uniref:hypothetical protein n=1 Tax=Streptomyces sp. YIM 98790 TaxID=2689077 RepID=UPI001407EFB4|nr:hypothetical protein [Streptomyces sp. YIM 98790]
MVAAEVIPWILLVAALLVGIRRWKAKKALPLRMVYQVIDPHGRLVEQFDPFGAPGEGRVQARGDGAALTLTRAHMGGPGVAWFEPGSPLIFELDSGAIHILPRRYITKVKPYFDEQSAISGEVTSFVIEFKPPATLTLVCVHVRKGDADKWLELGPHAE